MDKCLVITGGSRGIGAKTIELFLKNNWRVVNLSRTPCKIDGVMNMEVDLANFTLSSQQSDDLNKALQQSAQISVVHNAAVFENDSIKTLTAASLSSVLDVNVISAISINNLCIPYMQQGSSIIYIGSTLSEIAIPNRASYVISKHALIGLMRATCQDLAAEKIHTCCICPGLVDTTMITENADMNALNQFIEKKVIMGRLIEPHEIAEFILFCVNNPIINGSVLHANLGQTMS